MFQGILAACQGLHGSRLRARAPRLSPVVAHAKEGLPCGRCSSETTATPDVVTLQPLVPQFAPTLGAMTWWLRARRRGWCMWWSLEPARHRPTCCGRTDGLLKKYSTQKMEHTLFPRRTMLWWCGTRWCDAHPYMRFCKAEVQLPAQWEGKRPPSASTPWLPTMIYLLPGCMQRLVKIREIARRSTTGTVAVLADGVAEVMPVCARAPHLLPPPPLQNLA